MIQLIKDFIHKLGIPRALLLSVTMVSLSIVTILSTFNNTNTLQSRAETPSTTTINKKAYVLIYNPIMPNGQSLVAYKSYPSPDTLTTDYINFFKQVTNNRVNYSVVGKTEYQTFPIKKDGFTYTPQAYLDVIENRTTPHTPDGADYYKFLNDSSLDICGKLNRGEIDELWIFGGPWMGFYESTLATSPNGRHGFNYNDSGNTQTQTTCNRLMPIMGFSYEKDVSYMVHDLGHRVEATMTYLYGDWQENRMATNWDRFALNKGQSPAYAAIGCGSVHYPPNVSGTSDEYKYDLNTSVNSYCDDFNNYPSFGVPSQVAKSITCQAWGCNALGYYTWWFKHVPHFAGSSSDGILNDWWQYSIDPNKTPTSPNGNRSFTSINANFYSNQVQIDFTYAGWAKSYRLDVSTSPDMSTDVYTNFATSTTSPINETNPKKWDKYTCGRTLYWRLIVGEVTDKTAIQQSQVNCNSTAPSSTPAPNAWIINAQPRCSNGSVPSQKYKAVTIHWPLSGWTASNDLPQNYGADIQGDQSITIAKPSQTQSSTATYVGLIPADDPNGLLLQPTGGTPSGMTFNRYFCYAKPGTNSCSSAANPWFVKWATNSMPLGTYTIKFAALCSSGAAIQSSGSTMTYTAELVNTAGSPLGVSGNKVCTNKSDCATIQANGTTGPISLRVGSSERYKPNEWVIFTLTNSSGSPVNTYNVKNYGKYCDEATGDVRGSVLCDFISNTKQFKVRMVAGKNVTMGWTLSGIRITNTPIPTSAPTRTPTPKPAATATITPSRAPTSTPTPVPLSTIRSFNQSSADSATAGRLKQTVVVPDGTKLYTRFYESGNWQGWNRVDVVCTVPLTRDCVGINGVSSILSFSQAPNPQGQPKQDVLAEGGTTIYSRVYSGGWGTWGNVPVSALGISGVSSAKSFSQQAGDAASGGRLKQSLISSNGSTLYYRFYENGAWQSTWSSIPVACPSSSTSCVGVTGNPSTISSFDQAPNPQGQPKQDVLSSGGNTIYSRVYNGGWPTTWDSVSVSSQNIPQ